MNDFLRCLPNTGFALGIIGAIFFVTFFGNIIMNCTLLMNDTNSCDASINTIKFWFMICMSVVGVTAFLITALTVNIANVENNMERHIHG
jgi:ABC-type uncharacterized transport system fused permease/ATPase subunit